MEAQEASLFRAKRCLFCMRSHRLVFGLIETIRTLFH